jgi:DNA-binding IclR family transcriptional regulator
MREPRKSRMNAVADATGDSGIRVVKSAARTMKILEYFGETRRPLTVVEIATALHYPPSSAAALLRSLVELGYLHFQPRGRLYSPSSRLPLIGAWMNAPFFREGSILSLVRTLSAQTDETVFLAMPNGRDIQCVHVLKGSAEDTPQIQIGCKQPMVCCAAGHVALGVMRDSEIVRLAIWYDAKRTDAGPRIGHTALINRIRAVRSAGFAFGPDLRRPDTTSIAMRLPESANQSHLVVGVVGPTARFEGKREMLISTMRTAVESCFDGGLRKVLDFVRSTSRPAMA